MHLSYAQAGEHLLRQIELGRLRQMRNVAGVNEEGGLLGHPVQHCDGLIESAIDIRVRILVETDVCVADLNEERLPQPRCGLLIRSGHSQVDWREDTACQREEGAGSAKSHTLEGVAPRVHCLIICHVGLLGCSGDKTAG
jgi:hypothetical protein